MAGRLRPWLRTDPYHQRNALWCGSIVIVVIIIIVFLRNRPDDISGLEVDEHRLHAILVDVDGILHDPFHGLHIRIDDLAIWNSLLGNGDGVSERNLACFTASRCATSFLSADARPAVPITTAMAKMAAFHAHIGKISLFDESLET